MTDDWPTAFTELVGCRLPIQQAGMGAVSTVALAAAVAEAGGLGMIAPHGASPDRVVADLRSVADATAGAFGINFLMPFVTVPAVEAAASHSRYVEFFYGQPDADLVNRASANGARVGWQVGSADEAVAAVDAGCDLVIAQGTEGGGHVRGTLSLLPTLDAVLDRVDVPVVAAGGIATPRALAAVLAAGASGARIGTLFATAVESGAHPDYVRALLAADGTDTVITEVFSAGWPDAPHRVLRSCIDAAASYPSDEVARMDTRNGPRPVVRFSPEVPLQGITGDIAAMALYAGQGVSAAEQARPAGQIVADLVKRPQSPIVVDPSP